MATQLPSGLHLAASAIDVNSWYQPATLTFSNRGTQPLDLNQAELCFTANGSIDHYAPVGGSLMPGKTPDISFIDEWPLKHSRVVLDNGGPLLLAPGKQGTLVFNLAASQIPFEVSHWTLTLASGEASGPVEPAEPEAPAEPEEQPPADDFLPELPDEPDVPEEPDVPDEPYVPTEPEEEAPVTPTPGGNPAEASVAVSVSALSSSSWYQKVTFSLTNTCRQMIDLAQAKIEFMATGHPDEYSPFSGTLFSGIAPAVTRDGGWPLEKNTLVLPSGGKMSLAPGATGTLSFSLSATQTPVTLGDVHVTLVNDPARQGELVIATPASPLVDFPSPQVILTDPEGNRETHTLQWNSAQRIQSLSYGRYTLQLPVLENQEASLTPQQLQLTIALSESNSPYHATLAYHAPRIFAAAALSLMSNSSIKQGSIGITLTQAGQAVAGDHRLTFGTPLTLHKLTHQVACQVKITTTCINNTEFSGLTALTSFIPNKNNVLPVTVDYQTRRLNTGSMIKATLQASGLPTGSHKLNVSLISPDGATQYYFTLNGTGKLAVPYPLAAGDYHISAEKLTLNGRSYLPLRDGRVTVSANNHALQLTFEQGVELQVRGWPDYLAHGGVTVNSNASVTAYSGVPVSAIFKYDGFDGGGDPIPAAEVDKNGDGYLDLDSLPVHRTCAVARNIEQEANRPVMPVMVVYTANASGGSALPDLQDEQRLRNHFGSFITQCVAAQSYKDAAHPVPVTFVLNPDFLGAMQQEPYGYTVVRGLGSMKVNSQLQIAVRDLQPLLRFSTPLLPTFSDDLYGYLQAINFIVRHFAPDVPFGWQTNVWATGTADWVLRENVDAREHANAVVDFINELRVYQGQYAPDFIVFDKFERDCFSPDALAHYGWNASSWLNYLKLVKYTAAGLNKPAMIWQIPGGHMPTEEEGTSLIPSVHFASGGTFFMGDDRIGKDVSAIYAGLRNTAINPVNYGVSRVGEFLQRDNGYDWSQQQVYNLPDYNIFSILWGGGSTVSITTIHSNGDDGGWLAEKMRAYYQAPCYFSR
jgi:hypothetical protein